MDWSQTVVDHTATEARIATWQKQNIYDDPELFQRRLEADNLSRDELAYLVAQTADVLGTSDQLVVPAWMEQVAAAYAQAGLTNQTPSFLAAVYPLVAASLARVEAALEAMPTAEAGVMVDHKAIYQALKEHLGRRVSTLISKTFILELNIARLRGQLRGETPAERFQDFITHLQDPAYALGLLQNYPVLPKLVLRVVENWAAVNISLLQRLVEDWPAVVETIFKGEHPGLWTGLHLGAGDTHNRGYTVNILEFQNGAKLVYKPRSLDMEDAIAALLHWLNEQGDHPPLQLFRSLNRGHYGWVEFVAHQPCQSEAELRRFYRRQGCYMALLYILEATDFHVENLIASGEHPILIDLESLFQPRLNQSRLNLGETYQRAVDVLQHSVRRSGLLPSRVWGNAQAVGVDMSGLAGGQTEQLTPMLVPGVEAEGTDEMRVARRRVALKGHQNLPTLKGQPVRAEDYMEEVIGGFTQMYRLLERCRASLLAQDGPLAPLVKAPVRMILRPTHYYAKLLGESYHPDFLRDALDRDQYFEMLWVITRRWPQMAAVVPYEYQDLEQGDIPYFTTQADSVDLWHHNGRIPNFLDRPSLAYVHENLKGLGSADLTRQIWFIRASMNLLELGENWLVPPRRLHIQPTRGADDFVALACQIGDRLAETAVYDAKGAAMWYTLKYMPNGQWGLATTPADFYDGVAGIIFFLAYLGHVTQKEQHTRLAQDTLQGFQEFLELSLLNDDKASLPLGYFGGLGGLIALYTHLAVLWERDDLRQEALRLAGLVTPHLAADKAYDVIGGAAGCLISLVNLYRLTGDRQVWEAAVACGEHLVQHKAALPGGGVGWWTNDKPVVDSSPLLGFSHGAAGIAYALLELHSIAHQPEFYATAQAALAYERRMFSAEQLNWPDLRAQNGLLGDDKEPAPHFMVTWCHGAPGIGLSRVAASRHLPHDASLQTEIEQAMRRTLHDDWGANNHSLCHGALGNLELLLLGSQQIASETYARSAQRLASAICLDIEENGCLCGVPNGFETPGLMTGLAGIGYQMLRLAFPEAIPSVLLLEGPVKVKAYAAA